MNRNLSSRRSGRAIARGVGLLALSACVQLGTRAPAPPAPPSQNTPSPRSSAALDPVDFYRRTGLLAGGPPLAFTGSVAYLAAPAADSTHVVIALGIATNALAFRKEGDQYRADYRVTLTLRLREVSVARVDAVEPVRVASYRETSRSDESIIFQQLMTVPPGEYTLTVALRDEGGTNTANYERAITVPRFAPGALAAPIAEYEVTPRISRDSLPRLLMNPRAAVTIGRDTTLAMYMEAYGGETTLHLAARADQHVVWADTLTLTAGAGMAAGVARVPISRLGVGLVTFSAVRPGSSDTASTPVFIGFGEDFPVTTYADMLNYLKYFTSDERLDVLRRATPQDRGTAWQAFSRETDPEPGTSENEALIDYFMRLRQANERFRESLLPGWQTDRGMVFLLLGEPDQVIDQLPADVAQRGRSLIWEYRSLGLAVTFLSQGGSNQWRLTASSEAAVVAAARRAGGR